MYKKSVRKLGELYQISIRCLQSMMMLCEICVLTGGDKISLTTKGFVLCDNWTYAFKGVVNEDGTEMKVWNDITNSIDVFKWLTPEEVEELKQGRDDFDAPR